MATAIQSSSWSLVSAINGSRVRPARRRSGRRCPPSRARSAARHIAPAPIALHAWRLLDLDLHLVGATRRTDGQGDLRHDEEHRQFGAVPFEQSADRPVATIVTRAPSELPMTLSFRFCSRAAFTASRTSSSRSHSARSPHPAGRPRREILEMHRRRSLTGQVPPQLVGRDRQDRREQARQTVADDVHHRLRGPPLARLGAPACTSGPSSRRRRTR